MTNKNLWAWLGALLMVAVLAGCGGGVADGTTSQIRLLNASPDLATANLYTNSDQRASGVAPDSVSGYAELDPDTYTVKVTNSIGVTLASASQDLGKKARYTAVAWGRSGATGMTVLTEADSDTDGMSSGWGRLRVFNSAGKEAGNLDIYLLPPSTGTVDPSTSTPAMAATTTTVTSYSDLIAGTYRLVVTAAGNPSDVRLDLASFTLGNQQLLTLVLEPSSGGTLVHALFLTHQGGLVVGKNTNARVRVVASVAAASTVMASVSGVPLVGAPLTSPAIGNYVVVPAGVVSIAILVKPASDPNGEGLGALPDSSTLDPGADYTLLVTGTAAVPAAKTLSEDNRLPTNSALAKIRLVDGFTSGGSANLTVASVAGPSVTSPPGGSLYSQISPVTPANATVTVANGGVVWSSDSGSTSTSTTIVAAGVYTVFLLDGNVTTVAPIVAAPKGQLLKER